MLIGLSLLLFCKFMLDLNPAQLYNVNISQGAFTLAFFSRSEDYEFRQFEFSLTQCKRAYEISRIACCPAGHSLYMQPAIHSTLYIRQYHYTVSTQVTV